MNTGTGNLTFTSAPSTGSTEFVVASGTTCTTSSPVAPSGSCIINITFTPSASGARSAMLTIADNATGSPQTISLTGTGVATAPVATVTPSALVFTSQTVNTTSTAQAVTVKNTGNANLNITAAAAISATNAADFAVAAGTTCTNGAAVAPNATCVINITFTPTAAGARAATLSITDNAAGSPQTLGLTGTAVAAAPVASVAPTTVAVGGQLVTTTSTAQVVTVTNTGNSNLNITAAPSISGANAADFAVACRDDLHKWGDRGGERVVRHQYHVHSSSGSERQPGRHVDHCGQCRGQPADDTSDRDRVGLHAQRVARNPQSGRFRHDCGHGDGSRRLYWGRYANLLRVNSRGKLLGALERSYRSGARECNDCYEGTAGAASV